MAEQNGKLVTVAYVPYKTFTSALDSFVTFLPDQIDASMWPSYSGGTKSQLLNALKFLGLISEGGVPSAELRRMSENKDLRSSLMQEILRRSYPALFKLDLAKATPGSFDKVLREEYKQEGDTHRKAASFFLLAAKHAGIPLSPPLTAKGRLLPSRKKPNGTRTQRTHQAAQSPESDSQSTGPTKSIYLENDVVLTLTANKDTFQMSKSDRKFVLELLERLEEYVNQYASEADEADLNQADLSQISGEM